MNKIDGVPINKLVEEYGSPLFVVSAETLRSNLKAFRDEFAQKYLKVEVAYSYKVNCLRGVLNVIHRGGAWAEVASGFEYELARTLGVPGRSIVFNGPYKRKEELKKALREGALIFADHIDELKLLEEIASELGRTLDVGIRINTDVGIRQLPDRFGFNLESGEAIQIIKRCVEKRLLKIVGLHIHLTSYIVEPEESENPVPAKRIKLIWPKKPGFYNVAADKLVNFAEKIGKDLGTTIKYLDLGGGFPTVESLNPYVEAVVKPVLNRLRRDLPTLILEPGRAIVRDAVQLITTVVGTKEFPNGERGVIVDAGVNLLPTSLWKFQEIERVAETEGGASETVLGERFQTTVYGPLCLQTDIIARAKLSELKTGDMLVVKNAGAYNISQSSSFIFPRPAVIIVEKGRARVLRMTETVDDISLFEKI